MYMLALERGSREDAMRISSASVMVPVRTDCMFTPESEQSIRCTSCSRLISRLNMHTVFLPFTAAFWARLRAKAVLPMEGRPAIMMRSLGCMPEVSLSRSAKPVVTPVRAPLSFISSPTRL